MLAQERVQTFGQLVVLLVAVMTLPGSQTLQQCTSEQQRKILTSTTSTCTPHLQQVEVRHLLAASNTSEHWGLGQQEVVQVVPEVVAVQVCTGACHLTGQSCSPAQVEVREVEVMLVLAQWPQGEHQVVCTTVQVEEHTRCGCGCRLGPQHCSDLQVYHPSSCR